MKFEQHNGLLQTPELYNYVLETSVYPREHELLKEIRDVTASHPMAVMGTSPDAAQLIDMFLKVMGAKKTIEVGVFTGYSLLLTAMAIPDDGKVIGIDYNREAYEMGLPIIKKAGMEHKIEFVESPAIKALDVLLEDPENEGTFDFVFVDADKVEYLDYHERVIKLLRIGGVVAYDNTLWFGTLTKPEASVPQMLREGRLATLKLNKALASDPRIQLCHASIGDGLTICRRLI